MSAPTGPLFPELPERSAAGEIRAIYGDIRRTLGVPMVNLVYRHMATTPGLLPWAWASIRPALRSGAVARALPLVVEQPEERSALVVPTAALRVLHVDVDAHRQLEGILDVYNRANPQNLLNLSLVLALLQRDPGTDPEPVADIGSDEVDTTQEPLLPAMKDVRSMPATLAALIQTLPGTAVAVPSLYRHLANWPQLLAVQAVLLQTLHDTLDRRVERMAQRARRVAQEIIDGRDGLRAHRPPTLDGGPADRRTLTSFLPTICTMIIVGGELSTMTPPASDGT